MPRKVEAAMILVCLPLLLAQTARGGEGVSETTVSNSAAVNVHADPACSA